MGLCVLRGIFCEVLLLINNFDSYIVCICKDKWFVLFDNVGKKEIDEKVEVEIL